MPACETPGPGKSHTRECKAHQDAWEESRQTAAAGGGEARSRSGSRHTTTELEFEFNGSGAEENENGGTDAENAPDQMDVDSFPRTPATAHPVDPASDENVAEKARVARNVLHIRGVRELKFHVNEEAWPNADLAIHSSYEGALIDGLPADKVKAGDAGPTDERERSAIEMCAEGFRDDSER